MRDVMTPDWMLQRKLERRIFLKVREGAMAYMRS